MKKILVCFMALNSLAFAQIGSEIAFQEKQPAPVTAKESPRVLDNFDDQTALQPDNGENECCQQCCPDPCCWIRYFSLAFKPSYFWPQSNLYRHLYDGGFLPLFEATYTIYKWFNVFLEAGYYHKENHIRSVNLDTSSSITQVPLSFGLNYTYRLTSCIDLYLKAGPNWVYTKTWIDISGLKHVVKKNAFGGTFGTGVKFYLIRGCFVELFLNYLYDNKEICDSDSGETFHRQLGGLQAGGGLGYRF